MFRGEDFRVEVEDEGFDIIRGVIPIPIILLNGSNPVLSHSVESRCVEEFSVGITFNELVYPGFNFPELFLISENTTKFILESNFQEVEKLAMGII